MEFLDRLAGEWELTGEMYLESGAVPLRHQVSATWVLGKRFLEMRCLETDPRAGEPYEAIYLIGFDERAKVFVFHLFDTFGVNAGYKPATGRLEEGKIRFVFPYEAGPFSNTLWFEGDELVMDLIDESGPQPRRFAIKRLRRQ